MAPFCRQFILVSNLTMVVLFVRKSVSQYNGFASLLQTVFPCFNVKHIFYGKDINYFEIQGCRPGYGRFWMPVPDPDPIFSWWSDPDSVIFLYWLLSQKKKVGVEFFQIGSGSGLFFEGRIRVRIFLKGWIRI